MIELEFYNLIAFSFIVVASISFVFLLYVAAPYGRYKRKGWGTSISNRLGWIIMETPASILMIVFYVIGDKQKNPVLIVFLIIWQSHYIHRAFIYPIKLYEKKNFPVSVMIMGMLFNTCNTYLQGRYLFYFADEHIYTLQWFLDIRFIVGLVVFYGGYSINRNADFILRNLRKPGEKGYKIPKGGMFEYVSCPNYLGEIIEWAGWALLTWSLAGLIFFIWTFANLAPRAVQHHKWYNNKFEEYPERRKALIPFIW